MRNDEIGLVIKQVDGIHQQESGDENDDGRKCEALFILIGHEWKIPRSGNPIQSLGFTVPTTDDRMTYESPGFDRPGLFLFWYIGNGWGCPHERAEIIP